VRTSLDQSEQKADLYSTPRVIRRMLAPLCNGAEGMQTSREDRATASARRLSSRPPIEERGTSQSSLLGSGESLHRFAKPTRQPFMAPRATPSRERSRALARLMRHAQVESLAGASHAMLDSHPREVAAFIDRLCGR
jgi:pimeloyl-ACP methyl ester carboxylesterase